MLNLYEEFHKTTSKQTHLIRDDNFTYRIVLKESNKYLKYFKGKRLLDIGSGAGTLALYYASKGFDVTAIDVSIKAVQSGNESAQNMKINNIKFLVSKFPNSIPNGVFDYMLCIEVLEHLQNDSFALKKIFEKLKKSGVAIISVPSVNAPLYRLGLASKFDRQVGHLRRYSSTNLQDICTKTGFKVLEIRKTEGIIRNFLFINPVAGKFVRFIKFFISDFISIIDHISLKLFGESQIFIVVQKP